MGAMSSPSLAPERAAPDVPSAEETDNVIVLTGATWADFQRLLELRGERPVPRISYLEGKLQLMSPSKRHERLKSMIGRLVEAYCLERGVDLTPYGSWTLEDKAVDRGCEPDECFVFGDVEEPDRPDLAIEVALTSGGLSKLDLYRGLRVREVWLWKKGALTVHVLREDGYEQVERSAALPGIDLALLLRFVDVQPMTRAVREYRDALRGA
jgi:Uma2 family endonuclease